jgi:hypothetical protein
VLTINEQLPMATQRAPQEQILLHQCHAQTIYSSTLLVNTGVPSQQ